jgi:hypothetical protein
MPLYAPNRRREENPVRETQSSLGPGFGEDGVRKGEDVTAIIVIGVAAAAVIGLSITFGGPILAAILGAVIIVGGIAWFVAVGGSRTTAGDVARRPRDQEFLGPGGPDDPTA